MKFILVLASLALVLLLAIFVDQFLVLKKAHSTFENYYAFRGCKKLLTRTSTYGICKLADGQSIKIVQYKGKWYLNGDLPLFGINFF